MSQQKLAGKIAVVTGASKGIGAAIAKYLAAEGASVAVNYATSKAGADAVVDQITSQGGKAVAIQADVSKKPEIERLFAESEKALGRLDILVNNAGRFEFLPLEEVTEDHFHKQFNLNVLGMILTTQEAIKHFNPAGGSVINISSLVSTLAPPHSVVYSATKGAVDSLTGVLAKELGPRKIRVNAIRPGLVETEGATALGFTQGEFRDRFVSEAPLGRVGKPDDIAGAAVFLASDDSSWISGETLLVSGGHQ